MALIDRSSLTSDQPLHIHCLFHSPLGGQIHLPVWAGKRGYKLTESLVPETPNLPTPRQADCLVILGGPMSAWDEKQHPWLRREKRTMEQFIKAGKPVLGICLGAQLLAGILGARLYRGTCSEIGWFPVDATPHARNHPIGEVLPDRFEAFLWHGDTFDIPEGAVRLAESAAFPNQAFALGQVLALQFHLEVRRDWVRRLSQRDADQLVVSDTVQSAETMLSVPEALFRENNLIMEQLLDRWLRYTQEGD